jgi:hypothetical protein
MYIETQIFLALVWAHSNMLSRSPHFGWVDIFVSKIDGKIYFETLLKWGA